MSRSSEQVVLDVLDAVETRDFARLADLYHEDIEFHWPPGLPYGGVHCRDGVAEMSAMFAQTWLPLQLEDVDRRLDAMIVAAEGRDVVVHYLLKGQSRDGQRFAAATLAHYQIRDEKLARAQMYHFDLIGLVSFLAGARG